MIEYLKKLREEREIKVMEQKIRKEKLREEREIKAMEQYMKEKLHETEKIETLEKLLLEKLENYNGKKPILIDEIEPDLLKKVLFCECVLFKDSPESQSQYILNHCLKPIYHKIDFSNVSFDGAKIFSMDTTGSIGAIINPQTVYQKDLSFANLTDAKVVEDFAGVDLKGAKLEKSIIIDTPEITLKKLRLEYKMLCIRRNLRTK